MDPTELRPLMTVAKVATLLGFNRKTVIAMCVTGELEARKVRTEWRISERSVDAMLQPTNGNRHAGRRTGEEK